MHESESSMLDVLYCEDVGHDMDTSDIHLESALDEYNQKVNDLESTGAGSEELLEAYVNRGCVLYMMEYRTSAMEDLESAAEVLDDLESQGYEADAETYTRIHATMASILFDQDSDCTGEYELVSKRLDELGPHSRHFDRRSIVYLCIDACKNLIDSEASDMALPFVEKGLSIVQGHPDAWSQNRTVELLDLNAEAQTDLGENEEAVELYSQSIDLGMDLMDRGQLEDPEELIMSFVMKAEAEAEMDLTDMYIKDMEAAITILEHMMEFNRIPDPEILVRLHHDVAGALMNKGEIQEAEKHLMKAMRIGVQGAGDYIDVHGPRDFQ